MTRQALRAGVDPESVQCVASFILDELRVPHNILDNDEYQPIRDAVDGLRSNMNDAIIRWFRNRSMKSETALDSSVYRSERALGVFGPLSYMLAGKYDVSGSTSDELVTGLSNSAVHLGALRTLLLQNSVCVENKDRLRRYKMQTGEIVPAGAIAGRGRFICDMDQK